MRGLLGINMLKPISRPLSETALALMERFRPQLTAFSELCRDVGEVEANVALAWTLSNPAITSVIIGPCSVEDLNELLRSAQIELDKPTLDRIDEIFPGMGGTAPEAYSIFRM